MQCALTDRMTGFDTSVEKANEASITRTLDNAVRKSVQASTKNNSEAQRTILANNDQKGIDTGNI